jgi:hypothetical protein
LEAAPALALRLQKYVDGYVTTSVAGGPSGTSDVHVAD